MFLRFDKSNLRMQFILAERKSVSLSSALLFLIVNLRCFFINVFIMSSLLVLSGSAVEAKPSRGVRIELKTATQSFNHVQDFTLKDGKLWYRQRNDLVCEWQEIPLEDEGLDIRELKADGANLMLRDVHGRVHYKKVIKEWRNSDHHYEWKDVALSSAWIPHWFSVPIVSLPQSIVFKDTHLKLPEGFRSWAMSHRGIYNRYFEDIRGERHGLFPMVSTAYAIPKNGKDVLFADPFILGGFSKRIKGPHPDFRGEQIAASASVIFIVGQVLGQMRYYTRLADFDTLGRNPFLLGFWCDDYAGDANWEPVELPVLVRKAQLSRNITIFQNGEGNLARDLRIEGLDKYGLRGFYHKKIYEHRWQFYYL